MPGHQDRSGGKEAGAVAPPLVTGLPTAPCRGPQDLDILVTTDLVTLAGPSPFPGVSYRLQKEERCRAQLSHSRGLAREDSSTDPVCVYNSAISFVRDFFLH